MRAFLALSTAVSIVASAAVAQESMPKPCTLAGVLATRAAVREGAATFTQERRVKHVSEPVFAAGRLRYVAPDHLEMIVESPHPESFVYEDGVLTIQTGDAAPIRQISVDSQQVLAAMFAGLLGTLAGDEAMLKDVFHVGFNTEACRWRMTLVPKSKRVLAKVQEINLKGTRQRLEEAEILQANGDRSMLRISEQE